MICSKNRGHIEGSLFLMSLTHEFTNPINRDHVFTLSLKCIFDQTDYSKKVTVFTHYESTQTLTKKIPEKSTNFKSLLVTDRISNKEDTFSNELHSGK